MNDRGGRWLLDDQGALRLEARGKSVTLADIGFMASVFAEVDQPPPFVRLRGRSARVADRIDAGPRDRGSRGQAKRDEFDGGIGKAEGVGALVGRVESLSMVAKSSAVSSIETVTVCSWPR